jgi:hypothetical protein
MATISGTSGNDSLTSTTGSDTISLGALHTMRTIG